MNDTSLVACTVATCADVAAATVVGRTFRDQHPDTRFVTLLVDAVPGELPDDVLTPAAIGVSTDELAVLATGYTAEQACAILRPRLLEWLLGKASAVLYLDPWVLVTGPIVDQVTEALAHASLALVPKVLRPLPDDERRPSRSDLVTAGVYEPGFLAVGPGAEHVLQAWSQDAVRSPATSAAFLDATPAMVDHHVLRDPGIGLSVWNAAQRPLDRDADDVLRAGGRPLRTVHLTGFDPARPWLLSAAVADRPRVLLSAHPLLGVLCADYRTQLADVDRQIPVGTRFGALADGTRVPVPLQAEYRAELRAGTAPALGDEAFLDWACAPVAGLTRWAHALWREDARLQERCPDLDDFAQWCATEGVSTGRVPAAAVTGARRPVPLLDQLGVSVLGSGPLAEALLVAARAADLPSSTDPVYPVVLCCADVVDAPNGRHVVAVRTEPEPVPGADELWTPVEGTALFPVTDPGERDEPARRTAREAAGLTADLVFLALVDPEGGPEALTAFQTAFPDRADVALVVHLVGAESDPVHAEQLRLAALADERIHVAEHGARLLDLVDAADWLLCPAPADASGSLLVELTTACARGVAAVGGYDGIVGHVLDGQSAALVTTERGGSEVDALAATLRELADDPAAAAKFGACARAHVLATRSAHAAGEALLGRVERAYRGWRALNSPEGPADATDPLQHLRAARHALLRQPDVDVGHRIPMAPALRKAVLRVLNHYDAHLRKVLGTLLNGMERTTVDLVERQAGGDIGQVRAELDLAAQRGGELAAKVTASEDGLLRLRAELAAQVRALDGVSCAVGDETANRRSDSPRSARRSTGWPTSSIR